MNLLERIDLALQHARKSRGELAEGIGISTQAISNLKRRPGSELSLTNAAHAARWLKCDVYWLCTGEPEHYVPEDHGAAFSFLAQEVARWLDNMPEEERNKAFALIFHMRNGKWPCYPCADEASHHEAKRTRR